MIIKNDNHKKQETIINDEYELERYYKNYAMDNVRKQLESVRNPNTGFNASNHVLGTSLIRLEFQPLYDTILHWFDTTLNHKAGAKKQYADVLKDLTNVLYMDEKEQNYFVGVMTLSTVSTMLNTVLYDGNPPTLSTVATVIGKEIMDNVEYDNYCKSINNGNMFKNSSYRERFDKQLNRRRSVHNRNMVVQAAEGINEIPRITDKYSKTAVQALGMELLDIVAHVSSYFDIDYYNHNQVIIPSDSLIKAWDENSKWIIDHAVKYVPMIEKPVPWTDYTHGGYKGVLKDGVHLLRTHGNNTSFGKRYVSRLNQLNIDTVLKAVNGIQGTAWKIDERVLKVAMYIMKHGGGLANLPSVETPPKPMVLPKNPTEEQVKQYKKVMVRYYENEGARKGHCFRTNAMLRIADNFKVYPRIYFPCNMDFRGRVYPIPSFNFQGDDLTKGLIMFADPTPVLNEKDGEWLLVMGANHAGVDKVSYADRIKWVNDNHDAIIASTVDPLENHFWMDVDEPWQFLQWAYEYKRYCEYKQKHGGSCIGFRTGTVCAYDGTCSGLQHFSALLRDPVGGVAVNLVPQDKPNDIYRIVADKVNKQLASDVLYGTDDSTQQTKDGRDYLKRGTKYLALVWQTYGVTRKVTKRCVMTLAYGSKQYGFSNHILEDTITPERRKNAHNVFEECPKQCAMYLAKVIWDAVNDTVKMAVQGMKWLQDVSRIITKGGDKVVSWMTPAGLLVQQHYMETKTECYQMRVSGKRIRMYYDKETEKVDTSHQASGIAPNFIHSLDAAHLQRTVARCVDAHIDNYAMVHDSYGTDLGNAQRMFDTVRDEFYQMYTTCDPLEMFKDFVQPLVPDGCELPEMPKKSTLDLKCVKESMYIFS